MIDTHSHLNTNILDYNYVSLSQASNAKRDLGVQSVAKASLKKNRKDPNVVKIGKNLFYLEDSTQLFKHS